MKHMLFGLLVLGTTSVFAQTLTKAQFATLLQSNQATLYAVNVGMSKTTITTSTLVLEDGTKCEYTQTAVQSILKIEADKIIVLSRESFVPILTPSCAAAGLRNSQENILFFEAKPSLAQDLESLKESDVKTISRDGGIVTFAVNGTVMNEDETTTNELMTIKYDLTKSAFKNLVLIQSENEKVETTDAADIDVNTVDLHDVVFCGDNDEDNSECVRGDFSDILY